MVLVLSVVVLQSISFANYALTTKTTNIIYGSAPYLTFDGGRTRVTNTAALLGISLSDGRAFTPTTNDSSLDNPIELPVAGQSFNDIGMFIPTNTNSIALSSLIGPPNNYWGDDDGDGQGTNDITATGSLNLSIVNRWNNPVARNKVLNICRGAPYKLTLSNTEGTLKTRYGVPNESRFSASNATYYINPKAAPEICYAIPSLFYWGIISTDIFDPYKGFLPQSVTPSSYGLNFPTTGAHNLYFDLDIVGNNQALSWAPVSHGGITATMTNSTSTRVRVTLTGPDATPSQRDSENPGRIDRPSLPQTFELVGRDSSGNAVLKYGFVLKQWFIGYGNGYKYYKVSSWCNSLGYRLSKVSDLTNASCRQSNRGPCENYANEINALTATPSSRSNYASRHIGGGFISEWSDMLDYTGANYARWGVDYWTSDPLSDSQYAFKINETTGIIVGPVNKDSNAASGICTYP
ncbi:hypothetical protein A9G15_01870 [Gilliamella apis]|uniref:hypothetical protein n=1 Tax=Gilliamella apis TaxID=1970738 RepID=UPI00080EE542|nr:hypothetical protein [Gilliamella apis]OCG04762.1 hypothetical protein A9G15_01870 [Gilliamella apis]